MDHKVVNRSALDKTNKTHGQGLAGSCTPIILALRNSRPVLKHLRGSRGSWALRDCIDFYLLITFYSAYGSMNTRADPHRDQRSWILKLELQVVVSRLVWVLGIELLAAGSSL